MIIIGTCSWKNDPLKDIIYPGMDKFNYLEKYSKYYNTVEVYQWFWSLFGIDKINLPDSGDIQFYLARKKPKYI